MQIGPVTTNTKQANKGGWGFGPTQITHTHNTDRESLALASIQYHPIFNTIPSIFQKISKGTLCLFVVVHIPVCVV